MLALFTLLAAALGGLAADRIHLPGGLIFGSMIGAAAVTLASGEKPTVPRPLQDLGFIVIGAAIGVFVTRDSLSTLRGVLLPALLSAVLIILAGIAIAFLLRGLGLAPPGDVLATSPGALTVVSSVALDQGVGAVEVSVFHLVRVVLVIVSLPLVASMLE
jgi:membrane AbrB-like protein